MARPTYICMPIDGSFSGLDQQTSSFGNQSHSRFSLSHFEPNIHLLPPCFDNHIQSLLSSFLHPSQLSLSERLAAGIRNNGAYALSLYGELCHYNPHSYPRLMTHPVLELRRNQAAITPFLVRDPFAIPYLSSSSLDQSKFSFSTITTSEQFPNLGSEHLNNWYPLELISSRAPDQVPISTSAPFLINYQNVTQESTSVDQPSLPLTVSDVNGAEDEAEEIYNVSDDNGVNPIDNSIPVQKKLCSSTLRKLRNGNRFKSMLNLRNGPYKCPKCFKIFFTSQKYAAHVRVHYIDEARQRKMEEVDCPRLYRHILQSGKGKSKIDARASGESSRAAAAMEGPNGRPGSQNANLVIETISQIVQGRDPSSQVPPVRQDRGKAKMVVKEEPITMKDLMNVRPGPQRTNLVIGTSSQAIQCRLPPEIILRQTHGKMKIVVEEEPACDFIKKETV